MYSAGGNKEPLRFSRARTQTSEFTTTLAWAYSMGSLFKLQNTLFAKWEGGRATNFNFQVFVRAMELSGSPRSFTIDYLLYLLRDREFSTGSVDLEN